MVEARGGDIWSALELLEQGEQRCSELFFKVSLRDTEDSQKGGNCSVIKM